MNAKDFLTKYIDERLLSLNDITGSLYALFFACAIGDVAFDFDLIDLEHDDWYAYVKKVEGRRFASGITDVTAVAHSLLNDEDRWIAEWGEGAPDNPYTEKDYRYMDELFKTYSARSVKAGNFDAQVEFNIRNVCKQQLLADKSLAKGTKEGVDIYTKLTANILKILEAENLRAKDAEQSQTINIDDIEAAMQRKYGVGMEMTQEQALRIINEWQREQHYPITVDAVEEIIKIIVNCTRLNNDMPPLAELPKEARKKLSEIPDGTFESLPSLEENEAFEYLGIERKR